MIDLSLVKGNDPKFSYLYYYGLENNDLEFIEKLESN